MELTAVLENVTTFITSATSWGGTVLDFVEQNAILLLTVVLMPVAGYGIGWLSRLIRL